MNQILYTEKSKSKGPASIKSVVRFFSISLIILGIIFLGEGSYALYTNYSNEHSQVDSRPDITFEEESNNAIVSINHTTGISIIKYHWNDEEDTIRQGNSEKAIILDTLSIPSGVNTLYVSVTDDNNVVSSSSHEYSYDGICIDLSVINNTDIKITASDLTGLSYITYKWNDGEEITAYPDENDTTVIEQTTAIPSGLNTLSIVAVNSSNYTLTKNQEIKGIYPPKIALYLDGTDLIVDVTDEEGISKIVQQLNDNPEEVTYEGDGSKQRYTYRYILDGSPVIVTITATDVEGVTQVYKAKNY